jgi:uncharacterized protein (TIRG00374 family)
MTKKTAIQVLKIAVSIGLYVYIFWKVVDIGHLWAELKSADLFFFSLAVVVYFLAQGLSAYRWYLTMGPLEMRIPYPRLLSYYFLGMFFNFLMPTAIGGDVFRIYYLNKETKRLSASTTSVFMDRNIGMGGLMLVAAVVAAYAGTRINGVPLAPIFALVILAFAAANLALFYRPSYNALHRLLSIFKLKKADERVEHLFVAFNSFRGKWGVITAALGLSIAVQVGCAFVNLLAAQAIGLSTNGGWIDYLIFIPTIGLITMIPVSVNGMGWREFAYIVLFSSVGATEHQAAALAFLWFGVTVLTSLPGGIIYALRGGKRQVDIPTDEQLLEANTAYNTAAIGQSGAAPVSPREEESVGTM